MNNYELILLKYDHYFTVHMIASSKVAQLTNTNYTVLVSTNKSHCTFLYKTLMSCECTVVDTATNKFYGGNLKKILGVIGRANETYERVQIINIDLTSFTAMWSRLTSHFPEFSRTNELIVNAEESSIVVYPQQVPNFTFTVETDNPNSGLTFLTMKSVSTNGVVEDINLLNTQESATWDVRYKVSGSTITCIRTEMIDKLKLEDVITQSRARSYKYEFASSLEDAVICILSTNFEPKWY